MPANAATPASSDAARAPLTKDQARDIALAVIATKGMALDEGLTIEREFGWVFYYESKRYLETRDPNHATPGPGPLAVDRATGCVHELASFPGAIEQFEGQWRAGAVGVGRP